MAESQAVILRVHHFLPCSRANGPGVRAVIWVQRCALGCPGCFNPETHPANGGEPREVEELSAEVIALQGSVEGLTLSGGEPLQQRQAVTELLRRIKSETSLSVLLFSGFEWEDIAGLDLLRYVDVLIAGRYEQKQRLVEGLRGSANKTVHFLTSRYRAADLEAVPAAEVFITPAGEVMRSGIDPVRWSLA